MNDMKADYSPETTASHRNDATAWGWDDHFERVYADAKRSGSSAERLLPARVIGLTRHDYEIIRPALADSLGSIGQARFLQESLKGVRVSGRFEYQAVGPEDYPVVGDWVLVEEEGGTARIQAILPRRTALRRGAAGDRSDEQILAANIDTLLLVFALDGGRGFLQRLLERAVVVASNSGCAPCVVLNKADLASEEELERAIAEAKIVAPEAPVFAVSAHSGQGIEELAVFLRGSQSIGLLGKSGMGKSALINALASGDDPEALSLAREGSIREDDKRGRHTTTSSRLYRLNSGLLIIDSPGIRELKISGDSDDLGEGFPEIAALAASCRFADCGHSGEPGCAVQEALSSGELENARYLSYLSLMREQAFFERRADDRLRRAEEQKWKQISKFQKQLKKGRGM